MFVYILATFVIISTVLEYNWHHYCCQELEYMNHNVLLLLLHDNFLIIKILWHVGPLLGKGRERSSYTTVVSE
jgi:hypothetical protein